MAGKDARRTPLRAAFSGAIALLTALMLTFGLSYSAAARARRADQRKALRLHRQAVAAATSGDYVRATRLWREAFRLSGEPKYLYNLARTAEETDRPALAYRRYHRFVELTAPHARKHTLLRRNATRHLRMLAKRVTRVHISVSQEGTAVILDQSRLGEGPFERTKILDPGRHVVTAEKAGFHTKTLEFTAEAGKELRLEVVLEKIKPKIVMKVRLRYPVKRWAPWLTLGLGGLLAAVGVGPLVLGARDLQTFDRQVRDAMGGVSDDSLKVRGEQRRDVGISLLVVGGATMAAGILMSVLNRPKQVPVDEGSPPAAEGPRLLITPMIAAGSAGLVITWTR